MDQEKAKAVAVAIRELTSASYLLENLLTDDLFLGYNYNPHTKKFVVVYDERLEQECKIKASLLEFYLTYNRLFNYASDLVIMPERAYNAPRHTLTITYFAPLKYATRIKPNSLCDRILREL